MPFLHNRDAVHTVSVGKARVGKTQYRGIRFLLEEWLPEHDGDFWHNLPLNVAVIAQEAARRTGKDPVKLAERIKRLPPRVEVAWKNGLSGPWDFFCGFEPDGYGEDAKYLDADGRDRAWYETNGERDDKGVVIYPHAKSLSGARLCFDEVQDFCGGDKPTFHRRKWRDFLALLGHWGATSEAITQSVGQLADEWKQQLSCKFELIGAGSFPVPYLRFRVCDVMELVAAYTRYFVRRVHVHEYTAVAGGWVEVNHDKFWVSPRWYGFYDSFNVGAEGGKSGKTEPHEYEKRGFWGTHWWFLRRNLWFCFCTVAVVLFCLWIWLFNGGETIVVGTLHFANSLYQEAHPEKFATKDGKPPPGGSPTSTSGVAASTTSVLAESIGKEKAIELVRISQDLQRENERLKARYDAEWAITTISTEGVGFRNGDFIRIGGTVAEGPYRGEKLVAVDWWDRSCRFRSGRTLRMRYPYPVPSDRVPVGDGVAGQAPGHDTGASRVPTSVPSYPAGGGH